MLLVKMPTIKVEVFLQDKNGKVVTVGDIITDSIVEWFKERTLMIAEFWDIKVKSITFDKNLLISYTRLPGCDIEPEILNSAIAGPSMDSELDAWFNSTETPLDIGGIPHYVYGEIVDVF